jgi:exonuclease SbcC
MNELILLKKVKLRNILSHESTEITLPMGLVALVGPNGAGKSSIIDAIVYALFVSPTAAKGIRGEGKKSLIRAGATGGLIEVELSVGGRALIVQRTVSVNKPDSAILIEVLPEGSKKVIASGVQNVIESIERILSVPSFDAVRLSIISRQSELARFIEETEAKRKEIVLKLLGLEDLEKAKEALKEALKDIEKARSVYEEKKKLLNEATKKLENVRKSINELLSKKVELEKAVNSLSKEVERLERARDILTRFDGIKRLRDLVLEVRSISPIEGVCNAVLNIDMGKIVSQLEMYKTAKHELEEVEKTLNEYEIRINDLKQQLYKVISSEPSNADNLEKLITIVESKIDEIRRTLQFKRAEVDISERSIQIIQGSSVCPVCRRPLDEELKKNLLSDIRSRIRSEKKVIEELMMLESRLQQILSEAKNINENMRRYIAKRDVLIQQMKNALNGYASSKQILNEVIENVKSYSQFGECIELNDISPIKAVQCVQRKCIEYLKLLNERKNEVNALLSQLGLNDENRVEEEFKKLQSQLIELGIDVTNLNFTKLDYMYRENAKKLQSLRDELNRIEGKLEELEKIRKDLENQIVALTDEIKHLEKEVAVYGALDSLVNTILGKDGLLAKTLTREARRLIEMYTNNILSEFGMDFRIRIDEEFGIDVESPLGKIDLRGLSGGESVALAIALRLAIAYTIFGKLPGFLMLDEPTQFLDEERRKIVFEIIKRLSQRIPQVIVVTHDREVIDIADHVYFVFKEGGKSVVREKEQVQKELIEF